MNVRFASAARLLLAVLLLSFGVPVSSSATGVFDCGPNGQACSIAASIDGVQVATGTYTIDPRTGDLSLAAPVQGSGAGGNVSIDSISGNADPILGFSTSAGTGALGNSFSITLTLPIALSGTIMADSSVSYSLTSLTSAGAQIAPLLGSNIVIAQEVDSSIGGLLPLNKGVDVGSTFFFVGGPQTQNSPVYTASNSFTGDLAYDLMSVTIAFTLSANSNVGVSGFVQQLPEPTTMMLLGISLVGVAAVRRSRAGR